MNTALKFLPNPCHASALVIKYNSCFINQALLINTKIFYCVFRFSLSEVKLDTGLQSHLVIQQSDRQDSGLYVCEADNMFGHSKQTTLLAVQGNYLQETNFCH